MNYDEFTEMSADRDNVFRYFDSTGRRIVGLAFCAALFFAALCYGYTQHEKNQLEQAKFEAAISLFGK